MTQYITLAFLWMGFGFFHSFFAAEKWKQKTERLLKTRYKFYRITYSIFAIVTLGFIIFYLIRIHDLPLWQVTLAEKISAIIFLVAGALTMLIFSKRFFFDLSGADVFIKQNQQKKLIQSHLYKYVRHPLYLATLVFIWSIFFLYPSADNLISSSCITLYTFVGIYFEEKKLEQLFGQSYIAYKKKTPMLIPVINF